MESVLANRLKRREDNPLSAIGRSKDEQLAYFELFDCVDTRDYDQLSTFIPTYRDQVVHLLTDDSAQGLYYPKYVKQYGPTNRDDYVKQTSNGFNALVDLFSLYRSKYVPGETVVNPARMSINVLEQFPLKSWPAVVKLLTLKHHQT
jgi:hypothetical protein